MMIRELIKLYLITGMFSATMILGMVFIIKLGTY